MDKTVSVVIPCYNYGRYLKECVESVRNQTYTVHEIIVVDDGSTDDSLMDARIIMGDHHGIKMQIIQKENGGLSSARNAGILASSGEYIMCLDADDILTPGAIEEHVKLMEDDKTIAQCALMEFGERNISYTPITPTGLERIMQSNTIFCNAMFSKKMWEEVGGYDESEIMRLGYEDWEFWIRMLAHGCYVRSSDFIALRYRVHSTNMTKETTHPNRHKLYEYIDKKHIDLYNKYDLRVAGLLTNK